MSDEKNKKVDGNYDYIMDYINELKEKVEGMYKSIHGIESNEPDKIWKEIVELKNDYVEIEAYTDANKIHIAELKEKVGIISWEQNESFAEIYGFNKKINDLKNNYKKIAVLNIQRDKQLNELKEGCKLLNDQKNINRKVLRELRFVMEQIAGYTLTTEQFTYIFSDEYYKRKLVFEGKKDSGGENSASRDGDITNSTGEKNSNNTDSKPPEPKCEPFMKFHCSEHSDTYYTGDECPLCKEIRLKKEEPREDDLCPICGTFLEPDYFIEHVKKFEVVKREDLQLLIDRCSNDLVYHSRYSPWYNVLNRIKEEYNV